MKELIVKTALITLACLLGIITLVFGALAIFSPITLAKVFDRTGGYSATVYFYEKTYQKSGDIEDLAVLTIKVNQELDGEKAEEYLEELVSHQNFTEFCADEQGGELSNKQFYIGKYAVVLVKNSKFDKAIEVADAFVLSNGYTALNPYSVLLIELGDNLSAEQLGVIKAKLLSYAESLQGVATDLEYIEQLKSQS